MDKMPESKFAGKPGFRDLSSGMSALVAELTADGNFEREEEIALAVGNALVRGHLERRLQGLADTHGKNLLIDGVGYRQHEAGQVPYHSLVGDLTVRRFTYRQVGERNGPTVVPLELAAGLIERATPALAFSVAQGYAKTDIRDYAEHLEGGHRDLPSRTTLELMAKAIGTEARAAAGRIEPYLRQGELVPDNAVAASIGLDRTTVPMEEDRPPGQAPKTPRRERTKPRTRVVPPPVDVHWRQAYVGTIAFHDIHQEALVTRRYTALPNEEPEDILQHLMADLRNALRQKPDLHVGVVQDGAPELWNATSRALKAEPLVKKVHESIDRYHLNERLGEALVLVEGGQEARTRQLSEWNDALDASDAAIDGIEKWLLQKYSDLLDTSHPASPGEAKSAPTDPSLRPLPSIALVRAPAESATEAVKPILTLVALAPSSGEATSAPAGPSLPPVAPVQAVSTTAAKTKSPERPKTPFEKLWEHLVYIRNNKGRMRYFGLTDTGLPVGSGVTEGACKSVIGQRTGGSSQRWREPGIAAALTLRATHLSGRLPRFWKHLVRRYTATIRAAVAA